MKRTYSLIVLFLLISLYIYLLYRTEKTVINEIFILIFSLDTFKEMRITVVNVLPLHEYIIYSLPEGLWIFCITLTSKPFFIKISNYEINLSFIPILFAITLELFQLFNITNGRFDFLDIGISLFFWAIANYLIPYRFNKKKIFYPFTIDSFICILSYLIVYLSHVWK